MERGKRRVFASIGKKMSLVITDISEKESAFIMHNIPS